LREKLERRKMERASITETVAHGICAPFNFKFAQGIDSIIVSYPDNRHTLWQFLRFSNVKIFERYVNARDPANC
jgi:hypothetical protein